MAFIFFDILNNLIAKLLLNNKAHLFFYIYSQYSKRKDKEYDHDKHNSHRQLLKK